MGISIQLSHISRSICQVNGYTFSLFSYLFEFAILIILLCSELLYYFDYFDLSHFKSLIICIDCDLFL